MKPSSRRDLFAVVLAAAVFGTASLVMLRSLPERPLIGISSVKNTDYAEAIRKAGGIPVMLPHDNGKIGEHLERLDALLLPGGADVPPEYYGEERHPTVRVLAESRFRFELELARSWLDETDKPLLGVCLGCQMLNVVRGGSLVQDIPSAIGTDHRRDHPVRIEADSKLYSIFQTEELDVNSRHHQAVKETGTGLRVVARAPDGVIEGIELGGDRFVVGVQWHPESMTGDRLQEALYEEFVRRAAARTR